MIENPNFRVRDLIKIKLSSEESISSSYDYTRGFAFIIEKGNQSRFTNIDFITGEYTFSPYQSTDISYREISPILLHHESCLPGQPDLSRFPNINTTTEKPDFIELYPKLEQMFYKIQNPQKEKSQAA